MRKSTNRQRTLRHEPLEARQLLAIAAFDINIYSDNNGSPGELIPQAEVHVGDRFYVEITAQEFDPRSEGLAAISLDINWAPSVLQVVEDEFDPAKIITDRMPLLKDGFLRNPRGGIDNLRALSLASLGGGENIGNGQADRFAMIPFIAIAPAKDTPLWMQVGGSQIGLDTAASLNRDRIRFENQLVQVLPAVQTNATSSSSQSTTQTIATTNETTSLSSPSDSTDTGQATILNVPDVSPAHTTDVSLSVHLNNQTVTSGQVFTASISVADIRASSQGISGLGVNVNWDPSVLELVPPASGNIADTLNSKLTLFREGSVDQAAGKINDLGGAALPAAGIGEAIGIGQPETFAELQFRVLKAADNTSISVSPTESGAGLVGADTATVGSANLDLRTIAETGSPAIAVSLSGNQQNLLSFATRDATGNVISDLVRPANPDSSQSITIRNTGTSTLTVERIETATKHVTVEAAAGFSVSPGSSRTLQVSYSPTGNQPATWRPEVLELVRGIIVISNATNTPELAVGVSAKSTFDADINYDGGVDLADVSRFNNHFGRRSGQASYAKNIDPNGDGSVDLGDMGILNAQYGKQIQYTVEPLLASPANTNLMSAPPATTDIANQDDEMDSLLETLARSQLGL